MPSQITYALGVDGKLVHVNSVPNGIECGCICPHCKEPVLAKNGGKVREHHFAHRSDVECKGAYETTLHMLAKEILHEEKKIMLPYSLHRHMTGLGVLHDVRLEESDPIYGFVPDAEGILEDGRRLLIEFFVTHRIGEKKKKTIRDNHLLCVEIDLNSQPLDKEELTRFLVESPKNRDWVWIENVVQNSPDDYKPELVQYSWNLYKRIVQLFNEGTIVITPERQGYCGFDWRDEGFAERDLRHDCKYDTLLTTKWNAYTAPDVILHRSSDNDSTNDITIRIIGADFPRDTSKKVENRCVRVTFHDISVPVTDAFPTEQIDYCHKSISIDYYGFNVKKHASALPRYLPNPHFGISIVPEE